MPVAATLLRVSSLNNPLWRAELFERRLQNIFVRSLTEGVRDSEILELVAEIDTFCREQTDAAIATVFLLHKGFYVVRHCIHVAIIANMVAHAKNLPARQIESLTAAALTMNIGLWSTQEQYHKKKGALTQEERAYLHQHPEESCRILKEAGVVDPVWLEAVLQHHEKLDGTGYPNRRIGSNVSFGGRLLAASDIFCAKISSRPSRSAKPPRAAMRFIYKQEDKGLDPEIGRSLIKALGVYPPGTWVLLRDGSTGFVYKRGASANRPHVVIPSLDPDDLAEAIFCDTNASAEGATDKTPIESIVNPMRPGVALLSLLSRD